MDVTRDFRATRQPLRLALIAVDEIRELFDVIASTQS